MPPLLALIYRKTFAVCPPYLRNKNSRIRRADCIHCANPFYIRNLSICSSWYLQGILKPITCQYSEGCTLWHFHSSITKSYRYFSVSMIFSIISFHDKILLCWLCMHHKTHFFFCNSIISWLSLPCVLTAPYQTLMLVPPVHEFHYLTSLKQLNGSGIIFTSLEMMTLKMLLVLFSHPVMSDSLRSHRLQHTWPRCPSPSPEVCQSLCPLHQ